MINYFNFIYLKYFRKFGMIFFGFSKMSFGLKKKTFIGKEAPLIVCITEDPVDGFSQVFTHQ